MERRQFIAGAGIAATGAAAIAAAGFPAPAVASGNQTWRMVSRWPEGFPDQLDAARRLAERIAVMSDGRLTIEILNANDLGPYRETLDRLSAGEIEMARSLSYDWRERGLGFDIFTFVPFGMTDSERVIWLDHLGGQALWDGLYAPFGIKPFLTGTVGAQSFGWFAEPIAALEQFQGLRFRTTGVGADIVEALGGVPRVMGPSDLGPAIEAGELDAFELVGPAVDIALDVHRHFPVCMFPSTNQTAGSIELIVNQERWDALPADLKQMIETAARAEHHANMAEVHAGNIAALARLRNEFGVQIAMLPDDALTRMGEITAQILDGLRSEAAPEHQAIFDSYLEARMQIRAWRELTEIPFAQARKLPFDYPQPS